MFTIRKDMASKFLAQEQRIKLLEADKTKKQEEIETLKSVIINGRSSLNQIDNETRKSNLIVTGLSENLTSSLPVYRNTTWP